jgi:pimeloyl-ACP methyl ester carboxylesterase
VILLHGLGVNSSQWSATIPALAGYHVYAPDQIGFGRSDKPPLNYRVQTLVDFLNEFYEQTGIERASLVGNSLEGWVAAAFALAHPEKVDRIVLVDAAGYSQQRWKGPTVTREGLLKLNPATLSEVRDLLHVIFHNKLLITDQLVEAAYVQRLATGDGHVINAFIDSIVRGEDFLDGKLGELRAATLVIWGREDALTPLAMAKALVADIPNAMLTVLDNCGHVPHLECAGPFNQSLTTFLALRTHCVPEGKGRLTSRHFLSRRDGLTEAQARFDEATPPVA